MKMLRQNTKAQSTIEFTFAMIVVAFLIYGMVRVFRWVGMDLAQRRVAQDSSLTEMGNSMDPGTSELNPDFYRYQSMDAIYNGSVTHNGSAQ